MFTQNDNNGRNTNNKQISINLILWDHNILYKKIIEKFLLIIFGSFSSPKIVMSFIDGTLGYLDMRAVVWNRKIQNKFHAPPDVKMYQLWIPKYQRERLKRIFMIFGPS